MKCALVLRQCKEMIYNKYSIPSLLVLLFKSAVFWPRNHWEEQFVVKKCMAGITCMPWPACMHVYMLIPRPWEEKRPGLYHVSM